MTAVVRVSSGVVVEQPSECPKSLKLSDGRTISGFDRMSRSEKASFGYYEVEWEPTGPTQRSAEAPEILDDVAIYRAVLISVDDLRERLHQERRWRRDSAEMAGFAYNGHPVDSDVDSVLRISNAATSALNAVITGQSFSVAWTCQDGFDMALDAQGIMAMQSALTEHSIACHAHSKALAEALDEANDVAALMEVDLVSGWPAA